MAHLALEIEEEYRGRHGCGGVELRGSNAPYSEAIGRDSWTKLFGIESQASMRGKSGEVKKEEALLHSPR
jgi:hypothetical protein